MMKTIGSWLKVHILLFLCSFQSFLFAQSLVEDLAIEVKKQSREFSFTNKQTAFYYGETNATNSTSWQGFNVSGYEFVDDYQIWIHDKKLDRKSVLKTLVYPDYIKRIYPNGIAEELRFADSIALFSVTITSRTPVHVDIVPLFSDGRSADYYLINTRSDIALVARRNHLARSEMQNYPVWLAIHGSGFLPQRKSTKLKGQFSPLMFIADRGTSHTLTFCVADGETDAELSARDYILHQEKYNQARRARMEGLLTATLVKTDNTRFNKALAWAKLSLDALIMNQGTKGIFAGLPWFNDYWGRDTFIALPGATLVQGHFSEAKQILRSFAAFQKTDSTSTDFGRIPNRVTTSDMIYNTADGTPRFVMMAKEYVDRSGDAEFIAEIYPTIARATRGTIIYHCDSLGFLVHNDQETWMDAAGPEGPWSPRGNRANDIQAVWARQLEASIWFARKQGDLQSAALWEAKLLALKQNFPKFFLREDGTVADHLNADGSQDQQIRPNQIFAQPLVDEATRARVVHSVTNNLTYAYGVSSLSQHDGNFHPFHRYEPFYPKDAAYHNGVVWTWVQGSLISELCHFSRQELAAVISENTVRQILDLGAVGTQSELIDAVARANEKEPRLSGTFSQAWNLAEFIRNFYDNYLGARVDLLNHHLVLRPRLPRSLGSVSATLNLNGRALPVLVKRQGGSMVIDIDGRNLRKGGTAEVILPNGRNQEARVTFDLRPKARARIQAKDNVVSLYINGTKERRANAIYSTTPSSPLLRSLNLLKPGIPKGLRSLKGPSYPLLSNKQIMSSPKSSVSSSVLIDSLGDDTGVGAYTYPTNPNFASGILDLAGITVQSDSVNAYFELRFRNLADPGWHPEYGFQLTFAAVAIDHDSVAGSGTRLVGHNANFLLEENRAYERLILVGGGVRIEDQHGKILAEYFPTEADVANPIGNIELKTIRFAIPLQYLGKPTNNWTMTLLVGAQDDHGGAGIGEFRTVNRETSEWNGGGRMNPDWPNVYDTMVVSLRNR